MSAAVHAYFPGNDELALSVDIVEMKSLSSIRQDGVVCVGFDIANDHNGMYRSIVCFRWHSAENKSISHGKISRPNSQAIDRIP